MTAVAAVFALSGCGSGGSDATREPATVVTTAAGRPTPSATGTSGVPVPTASSPTATGAPTQGVEGVWLTARGAAKVQLVLGKGKASLTSTHLCGGTYTGKNGIALTLTCMDGNKDRTTGHGALAADGKTLSVRWTGGLTDTFSRTSLPSS